MLSRRYRYMKNKRVKCTSSSLEFTVIWDYVGTFTLKLTWYRRLTFNEEVIVAPTFNGVDITT